MEIAKQEVYIIPFKMLSTQIKEVIAYGKAYNGFVPSPSSYWDIGTENFFSGEYGHESLKTLQLEYNVEMEEGNFTGSYEAWLDAHPDLLIDDFLSRFSMGYTLNGFGETLILVHWDWFEDDIDYRK